VRLAAASAASVAVSFCVAAPALAGAGVPTESTAPSQALSVVDSGAEEPAAGDLTDPGGGHPTDPAGDDPADPDAAYDLGFELGSTAAKASDANQRGFEDGGTEDAFNSGYAEGFDDGNYTAPTNQQPPAVPGCETTAPDPDPPLDAEPLAQYRKGYEDGYRAECAAQYTSGYSDGYAAAYAAGGEAGRLDYEAATGDPDAGSDPQDPPTPPSDEGSPPPDDMTPPPGDDSGNGGAADGGQEPADPPSDPLGNQREDTAPGGTVDARTPATPAQFARQRAIPRETSVRAVRERQSTVGAPAQLPRTGSEVGDVARLASLLVAGGSVLMLASRRRREPSHRRTS
jgi:hypothetical protein